MAKMARAEKAIAMQPKTDEEWRACDDANTLKNYNAISTDPKRLAAAKKVLQAEIELAQAGLKA
jgi:hypothetical protein